VHIRSIIVLARKPNSADILQDVRNVFLRLFIGSIPIAASNKIKSLRAEI